jgi:multidrug efflux pump subunit AcrB
VDAKNEAEDIRTLRTIARQAQDIVAQTPGISVLRDDWFPDNLQLQVQIDPDRANVVGITNADVASASSAAMSGTEVGVFKEGNKNIPVVARLRMQERAQLADIKNLYVYAHRRTTACRCCRSRICSTSCKPGVSCGESTFAPFPSCVIRNLEFSRRKCSIR